MNTQAQSRKGRFAAAVIRVCWLATLGSLPLLGSACEPRSPVAAGPPAIPEEMVWVNPTAQRLAVGDEQEFSATFSTGLEMQGAGKVFWSISDEEVATLTVIHDRLAVVTARAPGWAIITATSGQATGRATIEVEGLACGKDCREPRPVYPLGGAAR